MVLEYKIIDNKYKNINQILKQEFKISSRLMNKLIKNKYVYLNNLQIDTRSSVNINDIIKIDLNYKEDNDNIIPTKMNLNILYEDECFLILNKPTGIAVHPSILHYENSLSNGVRFYFDKINLKKKIRPINRLDSDTSGIVIFAKNEYVQERLINQMNEHVFKKEYIAIVSGILAEKKGSINLPICRKENSIIERCVSTNGQTAITDYKVISELNNLPINAYFPSNIQTTYDLTTKGKNLSVVKCYLKTGRTHQIRVHFQAIGHPLIGDSLYGVKSDLISRQALHSYSVSFIHPVTKKVINIICDLPDDMKKIINFNKNNGC